MVLDGRKFRFVSSSYGILPSVSLAKSLKLTAVTAIHFNRPWSLENGGERGPCRNKSTRQPRCDPVTSANVGAYQHDIE